MNEESRPIEFEGKVFPRQFDSRQQFDDAIEFLQQSNSFIQVPVTRPTMNVGSCERWFRGRSAGMVLRIIEPDAPYPGECEIVD